MTPPSPPLDEEEPILSASSVVMLSSYLREVLALDAAIDSELISVVDDNCKTHLPFKMVLQSDCERAKHKEQRRWFPDSSPRQTLHHKAIISRSCPNRSLSPPPAQCSMRKNAVMPKRQSSLRDLLARCKRGRSPRRDRSRSPKRDRANAGMPKRQSSNSSVQSSSKRDRAPRRARTTGNAEMPEGESSESTFAELTPPKRQSSIRNLLAGKSPKRDRQNAEMPERQSSESTFAEPAPPKRQSSIRNLLTGKSPKRDRQNAEMPLRQPSENSVSNNIRPKLRRQSSMRDLFARRKHTDDPQPERQSSHASLREAPKRQSSLRSLLVRCTGGLFFHDREAAGMLPAVDDIVVAPTSEMMMPGLDMRLAQSMNFELSDNPFGFEDTQPPPNARNAAWGMLEDPEKPPPKTTTPRNSSSVAGDNDATWGLFDDVAKDTRNAMMPTRQSSLKDRLAKATAGRLFSGKHEKSGRLCRELIDDTLDSSTRDVMSPLDVQLVQ